MKGTITQFDPKRKYNIRYYYILVGDTRIRVRKKQHNAARVEIPLTQEETH